MQIKRIAVFIPSLRGGGVERFSVHLTKEFVEKGHEVDLVLTKAEGPNLVLLDPRVNVVDLRSNRVAGSMMGLIRYLKRRRPVALLSCMAHANVIALMARFFSGIKTRLVISVHNIMSRAPALSPLKRDRVLYWIARIFYRFADKTICVSAGIASDVVAVAGLNREEVEVIPNPVPAPKSFAPCERDLHPWLLDDNLFVIMGLGRLVPEKGFDILINAFARISYDSRCRLLIYGEGRERAALEAQIDKLGLSEKVSLPGYINDPGPALARAAVLAVPSRLEGFGIVIVEAMHHGTPVVASDCPGGPKDILDNGELCPIVPVGDERALALAIVEAMAESKPVARLINATMTYRPDQIASRYLKVLLD